MQLCGASESPAELVEIRIAGPTPTPIVFGFSRTREGPESLPVPYRCFPGDADAADSGSHFDNHWVERCILTSDNYMFCV